MKRLYERTEIAKAMNFGKYPVIKIDLANKDEYGIKGPKVRIDFGANYFIHAEMRAYSDEKVLTLVQGPTVLKAHICYQDYIEMSEYAVAPIIKPDQEILIFIYDSELKDVHAPVILKTGERIDTNCIEPMKLERFEIL